MLFLYLIAPPVIAAQPLDNGAKTKQWMTAFLVQSLSVFGTVIAMRLLLIFLPLVVSPELVLFEDSAILNALAKLLLIYGGFEAAKKSSSILTGILADSAGWQAVQAGDMSSSAGKAIGTVTGAAKKVGGAAYSVGSFAAKPISNRVKAPFQRLANAWSNSGSSKYAIQASESKKQEAANKAAGFGKDNGGSGGSGGSSGGGKSSSPVPASRPIPPAPPSGNPGSGSSTNHNIQNSQNHQSNQNTQSNQNSHSNQNLRQQPAAPGGNPPQPANPGNGPQPANPVNNQAQPANPVNNQAQPAQPGNGPAPAQPHRVANRPPVVPQNLNNQH
jgi:hypothetical protein